MLHFTSTLAKLLCKWIFFLPAPSLLLLLLEEGLESSRGMQLLISALALSQEHFGCSASVCCHLLLCHSLAPVLKLNLLSYLPGAFKKKLYAYFGYIFISAALNFVLFLSYSRLCLWSVNKQGKPILIDLLITCHLISKGWITTLLNWGAYYCAYVHFMWFWCHLHYYGAGINRRQISDAGQMWRWAVCSLVSMNSVTNHCSHCIVKCNICTLWECIIWILLPGRWFWFHSTLIPLKHSYASAKNHPSS